MLKNEEIRELWEDANRRELWEDANRIERDLILSLIEALAEIARLEHDVIHDPIINPNAGDECNYCCWSKAQWFEAKRKEILGD